MKKRVIAIVVILCCVLLGIGIFFIVNKNTGEDEKYTLYIKQQSFAGSTTKEEWDAQEKSNREKEVEKHEVTKGKKINFKGMVNELEIEVKECSKDEIKIWTNIGMSIEENGVMDLVKTRSEFIVKKGEKIRLITPTMDAYDMYEIEYR